MFIFILGVATEVIISKVWGPVVGRTETERYEPHTLGVSCVRTTESLLKGPVPVRPETDPVSCSRTPGLREEPSTRDVGLTARPRPEGDTQVVGVRASACSVGAQDRLSLPLVSVFY